MSIYGFCRTAEKYDIFKGLMGGIKCCYGGLKVIAGINIKGARTIVYVGGSTNHNKCYGKSGGGGPIHRRSA